MPKVRTRLLVYYVWRRHADPLDQIGIGGRDDRPPPTPPDMRVRIRRFG